MRRRTLFTGLAAVGAAGTAAAVFGRSALADSEAAAAKANYQVAITEQVSNKVMIFARNSKWDNAHMLRSFRPGGGGGWSNLSDVKFRETHKYNNIGLFTCSGGNVGVWNLKSERHQEFNDVLWWATPGGNPHAIERIPHNGSVVTASSKGYISVYGPKSAVMSSLGKKAVQTFGLPGAHGVLWDEVSNLLWAVGDKTVRSYKVTGSGRGTRLREAGARIKLPGLGHDLQADHSNKGRLLVTDTKGVYEITKSNRGIREIRQADHVKSFCRHSSGEAFWTIPNWPKPSNWRTNTVGFDGGYSRKRGGAGIYKARLFYPKYQ
ncbi:DUF6528 family protein [Stackebrandtia nassauensis]|uniref:Uncharacterized protein n=1 Tax=Stackebrandtia nassauensis (strain DSM 44728 / CIP 108903 / NRRL B-16338 / NBRC 102104 / LLR-40K-21) TaxID=446470 RepID=D3Q593_STANL|nr:DUF6528 family protein [Stackebrandtia nassauensis]ADD44142.1 hypothetical protein Snas_4497 [Stackebrandtia nassauensis DSM 44728]